MSSWFKRLIEKLEQEIKRVIERFTDKGAPSDTPETPGDTPEPPSNDGWSQELRSFDVRGNKVEFWTRDVRSATPPGNNADGGMEWIIARIEGSGYQRLLIMVMGGNRPPSRIYHQISGSNAPFTNNVFPVPLMGDHLWRVESSGGALRVFLDNRQIWESRGSYGVSKIVFNGYSSRGFRGQWKLVG